MIFSVDEYPKNVFFALIFVALCMILFLFLVQCVQVHTVEEQVRAAAEHKLCVANQSITAGFFDNNTRYFGFSCVPNCKLQPTVIFDEFVFVLLRTVPRTEGNTWKIFFGSLRRKQLRLFWTMILSMISLPEGTFYFFVLFLLLRWITINCVITVHLMVINAFFLFYAKNSALTLCSEAEIDIFESIDKQRRDEEKVFLLAFISVILLMVDPSSSYHYNTIIFT